MRRETGPCIPSRRAPPLPSELWSRAPRSHRTSPRCPSRSRRAGRGYVASGRRRAFPESGDEGSADPLMASRGAQIRHARFTGVSAPVAPTRQRQGAGEGNCPAATPQGPSGRWSTMAPRATAESTALPVPDQPREPDRREEDRDARGHRQRVKYPFDVHCGSFQVLQSRLTHRV